MIGGCRDHVGGFFPARYLSLFLHGYNKPHSWCWQAPFFSHIHRQNTHTCMCLRLLSPPNMHVASLPFFLWLGKPTGKETAWGTGAFYRRLTVSRPSLCMQSTFFWSSQCLSPSGERVCGLCKTNKWTKNNPNQVIEFSLILNRVLDIHNLCVISWNQRE